MSTSKHLQETYDLIIVGGGPSGMMAAGTAAASGKSVLLIEKNKRLGEKLRITGGGRCNITNAELDLRKLLKNYGKAEKFLYSAFSQFGVEDTFTFFESRGLPLVIEELNRAFPHTHHAPDVERAMEEYCRDSGVTVLTNSPVEKILTERGMIIGVIAHGSEYLCKHLILATGGMSHPETGSTGDAFAWLRDLGHTIAEPTPSLVPLAVRDAWIKNLAGVTLSGVKISFFVSNKKQFSVSGNVLCTHFGLSGPLILNAAGKVADLLHVGAVTGTIDLFPGKDMGALEQDIMALFNTHKNKLFKNVCTDIVTPSLADAILSLLPLELREKKVHSVTKEERKVFVELLKMMRFNVKGLMGYDKAVVADGGVPLEEVDMRTMCSKKYPNLSLTGDLLHINRPSGGFSLQLCWTTGYVVGKNV